MYLNSILMGLVQGITEFLPISSDGHLVLAAKLLGEVPSEGILFEVLLHTGTLLATLLWFRRDIVNLLMCLGPNGDKSHRKIVVGILVASVPTALIGLTMKKLVIELSQSVTFTAAMLVITGCALFAAERFAKPRMGAAEMDTKRHLIIGVFQGLAVLPGISRSAATISSGMLMGVSASDAARFSFLLSIPAVFGATLLEARHITDVDSSLWPQYFAGMVAAFFSGLWAIRYLMKVMGRGKFSWFYIYLWIVGGIFLVLG